MGSVQCLPAINLVRFGERRWGRGSEFGGDSRYEAAKAGAQTTTTLLGQAAFDKGTAAGTGPTCEFTKTSFTVSIKTKEWSL